MILLTLGEYWLWIGAVVAVAFLLIGVDRIDEDARGAYVFRPLLVPGILLIWPLVLWRWWVLESGRDDWRKRHLPERRAHRIWAVLLAGALLLLLTAGFTIRQTWPADYEPERIGIPG